MRPLKILHLLSQVELTGSEVYAQLLTQALAERHHTLFTISDKFHRLFPGHLLNLPLATRSTVTRFQNILKIIQFIKKNKIDIVHCHSRGACRHAYWARLLSRGSYPIITTLHCKDYFSSTHWGHTNRVPLTSRCLETGIATVYSHKVVVAQMLTRWIEFILSPNASETLLLMRCISRKITTL